MARREADIAALLGSRICHDLVSPLGAIANGVELLELDGAARRPEISLIGESAENATARIRLFRVAFGAASAEQCLSAAELRRIAGDLSTDGRLTIVWSPPDSLPRHEAKLLVLLLLCLETAMPWGGMITLAEAGDGWRIEASAGRLRAEPELWQALDGAAGRAVTAAEVQFLLAPAAAAEIGRTLHVDLTEGGIRIET